MPLNEETKPIKSNYSSSSFHSDSKYSLDSLSLSLSLSLYHTHTHTLSHTHILSLSLSHTHTHTHSISLSFSLSLSLSLVSHQSLWILKMTSSVRAELMTKIFFSPGVSMCRNPPENVTYEFVPASLAVLNMSYSSYVDVLWDRRQVAVQLLFFRVMLTRFIQYSTQCLCTFSI